jgi:hypothetical protein
MGLFGGLEASLKLNASDFSRGLRGAMSRTKTFGGVTTSVFDNVGDEASAMSRAVSRSKRGFANLADSMKNAIVPASILQGRLNEVGDEASSASRNADSASRSFVRLAITSSGLSFSLGVLSTVAGSTAFMIGLLTLALIPLLAALTPIIIGAAALAAAFGVIIGTGIIAWGKGFKKAMKNAWKEIKPLIKAFGKQFIPLLKDAIKALPGFVKAVLNAIGPLDKFVKALRDLGTWAAKVIPKLIKWFFDLGRKMLPTLRSIGQFVVKYVIPAFLKLVKFGKQVIKFLKDLWKRFQKATAKGSTLRKKFTKLKKAAQKFWKRLKPVVKELGQLFNALKKVAPIIAGVAIDVARLAIQLGTKLLPYLIPIINGLTKLVKWFNSLSKTTRRWIIAIGGLLVVLAPILGILSTLISVLLTVGSAILTVVTFFNPLTLAVLAIGALIVGLALLIKRNWNKIVSATKWLMKVVGRTFDKIMQGIKSFIRGAGRATNSFIDGLVKGFTQMSKDIYDAVVGGFNNLISYIQNDLLSDIVSAAKHVGQSMANALTNAFNSILPDAIPIPSVTIGGGSFMGRDIPSVTLGGGSINIPSLDTGGFVTDDGLAMIHQGETVIPAADTRPLETRTQPNNRPQEIHVSIDTEDPALSEWIKDRAKVTVNREVTSALDQAKRRRTFE